MAFVVAASLLVLTYLQFVRAALTSNTIGHGNSVQTEMQAEPLDSFPDLPDSKPLVLQPEEGVSVSTDVSADTSRRIHEAVHQRYSKIVSSSQLLPFSVRRLKTVSLESTVTAFLLKRVNNPPQPKQIWFAFSSAGRRAVQAVNWR